jgi:hypothetical protein
MRRQSRGVNIMQLLIELVTINGMYPASSYKTAQFLTFYVCSAAVCTVHLVTKQHNSLHSMYVARQYVPCI